MCGVGAAVARHAQAHGAIVRNMGDTVAFSPPLIITRAEIEALLSRTHKALDGALAEVKAQGVAIA